MPWGGCEPEGTPELTVLKYGRSGPGVWTFRSRHVRCMSLETSWGFMALQVRK